MVHRPMPPSIQWGAATIVRADWRRRSCFQPGCLPHCCRRTLHQHSRGATGLGEQPGCTPHPVLMQRREWLRPCSMPTPRFRQSIERYRSQFVSIRSCKAGQVKVRLARAAVDETRSKARERHLSASHLREEGHAESSYPPLLHRRSPSLLHPR